MILVVEDEILISLVIEESLRDAGYEVALVHDGAEALRTLEAGMGGVEALITDIRLGGALTGWDIAARARELAPDLPVIYASGDSASAWRDRGVAGSVMLAKPYSMKRIVDVTAELLCRPETLVTH